MSKPYADTVEDAMFLWDSGERDAQMICRRLGIKQDTVETAFRRLGLKAPWIVPMVKQ